MNFIAPFSFPLFIDRGSEPAFCDFCSYYLKRGREDEFYNLWLCCSPQRACGLLLLVLSSGTLSLSHYLTQRVERNFTVRGPLFCPSFSHISTTGPSFWSCK